MAFSMKMGKLSMDNTPIYQVDTEKGVMGQALNNGSILIDKHLSGKDKEEVIKHEKVHLDQMSRGDLDYDDKYVYWKGKKYPRGSFCGNQQWSHGKLDVCSALRLRD